MSEWEKQFTEYTYERLRLQCQARVPWEVIQDSRVLLRPTLDAMAVTLVADLLTRTIVDVHQRWPATWWDAVKERWAPAIWLERHPVRYNRFDYTLADALAHRVALPGPGPDHVTVVKMNRTAAERVALALDGDL